MAWYRSGGGGSGGGLDSTLIVIHTATYDPETDVNPFDPETDVNSLSTS